MSMPAEYQQLTLFVPVDCSLLTGMEVMPEFVLAGIVPRSVSHDKNDISRR